MWRIPGSFCGLLLPDCFCCLSPPQHRFLITLLFNLMHSNVFQSKWKVEFPLVATSVRFQSGDCRGLGPGGTQLIRFLLIARWRHGPSGQRQTCENPSRLPLLTWSEFFSLARIRRERRCFCQRQRARLQDRWLQVSVCAPVCVILNWGSGRRGPVALETSSK